jgi:hypothetical protein
MRCDVNLFVELVLCCGRQQLLGAHIYPWREEREGEGGRDLRREKGRKMGGKIRKTRLVGVHVGVDRRNRN